jgi:hypothetical protein
MSSFTCVVTGSYYVRYSNADPVHQFMFCSFACHSLSVLVSLLVALIGTVGCCGSVWRWRWRWRWRDWGSYAGSKRWSFE